MKPAKLRMKLRGTLFSSLSMPRPSNTSELPIKVKMAIAHRMMRIRVRFSKFSVEDNPIHFEKFYEGKNILGVVLKCFVPSVLGLHLGTVGT